MMINLLFFMNLIERVCFFSVVNILICILICKIIDYVISKVICVFFISICRFFEDGDRFLFRFV